MKIEEVLLILALVAGAGIIISLLRRLWPLAILAIIIVLAFIGLNNLNL